MTPSYRAAEQSAWLRHWIVMGTLFTLLSQGAAYEWAKVAYLVMAAASLAVAAVMGFRR